MVNGTAAGTDIHEHTAISAEYSAVKVISVVSIPDLSL
jgi:hypothetical protein